MAIAGTSTLATHPSQTPGVTGFATPAATSPVASTATALAGSVPTTTYHHPFYDITQQAFVDAQYLRAGDQLQTPTGHAIVTSVRLFHADTTTYDLTIGDLHTFYVVAGDTPVLVHNIDVPCDAEKFPNLEFDENKAIDISEAKAAGVIPAAPGTPEFDSYIAAGRVKWAVTPDGSLRVVPGEDDWNEEVAPEGIFHSAITGDVPKDQDFVYAAGEARIYKTENGYEGDYIDYHSGHYQPSEESLNDIGIPAWAESGITFNHVGDYDESGS